MPASRFLNCDWGTNYLRVRLIAGDQQEVLEELHAQERPGRIMAGSMPVSRAERFQATLQQAIFDLAEQAGEDLSELPVLISGIASAPGGWLELPLAQLPFALDGSNVLWHEFPPGTLPEHYGGIYLLSGVRGPHELMRGEETEVLGAARLVLQRQHLDEAVLVLPGTHSKHVHTLAGQMVDFQTYLTGELFEVLSRHSVLGRSTLTADNLPVHLSIQQGSHHEAFQEGVGQAAEAPLSSVLFRVRTRHVLEGHAVEENAAFLSGILIGSELAGLNDHYPSEVPIVLCAGKHVHNSYLIACETLDIVHRLHVVAPPDATRLSALGQAVVLEQILQMAGR